MKVMMRYDGRPMGTATSGVTRSSDSVDYEDAYGLVPHIQSTSDNQVLSDLKMMSDLIEDVADELRQHNLDATYSDVLKDLTQRNITHWEVQEVSKG